ncbi:MAG TPA: putative Ig domain-containing protein [Deltaproteobacteria bacterium]|nr:putative Ig domain-containing protein [Deltaproteobacteria bacterium]HOI06175.1 putative Ig domain-containing protein [Deltaproteobacteria bacterium]
MKVSGSLAVAVLCLVFAFLPAGCGGGGDGTGPALPLSGQDAQGETDTSRIISASLPLCKTGVPYESNAASHAPAQVLVKDGNASYTFSLESGSLPPGLTLNGDGVVSGTTNASPGSYPFILRGTSRLDPSDTFTQEMSILVSSPGSGRQPYAAIAQDPRAFFVHQDAGMCGPAAFYTILKYFGDHEPGAGPTNADLAETIPREGVPVVDSSSKMYDYFDSLGEGSAPGTAWTGLEDAANTLRRGRRALYPCIQSNADETKSDEAGTAQREQIFEGDLVPFLLTDSPVIIHLKRRFADLGVSGHYLVVIGYDRATGEVLYLDPNDSGFDPREEGYDPDALDWSEAVRRVSRDDFINSYWYQKPWYPDARWDGKWLGFTRSP